MDQNFLHKILIGNTFQSIQVHFEGDQKSYAWLEVSRNKEGLSISDNYTTDEFEKLLDKVSVNKPIVVSFTGQGIISKKLENTPNHRSKLLFKADPDDFYWYEVFQERSIFASVARKEWIDAELQGFKDAKLYVLDITIGPWVAVALQPLIPSNELQTRDANLIFEKDQLFDFQKVSVNEEDKVFTIGNEQISSTYTLGFAAILDHLYPNDALVQEQRVIGVDQEEFLYKKAFNTLGVFVLAFFLVSLLASYLLLGYYQSENQKVEIELGQQNIAYSKLVSLEKDKENKEAIIRESGLSDANFLSFYLAEISNEVPNEVSLSKIKVFPTLAKIKPKKRINFINNHIHVEGTVNSNEAFANWVEILKKEPWIENLEIINLEKEGRTNAFKLKLILKFNV